MNNDEILNRLKEIVQNEILLQGIKNIVNNAVDNGWITLKDKTDEDGKPLRVYIEGIYVQPEEYKAITRKFLYNYKKGDETQYFWKSTTNNEMKSKITKIFKNLANEYSGKSVVAVGTEILNTNTGGVCTSLPSKNICTITLNSNLAKETNIDSWEKAIKAKTNVGNDDVIKSILTHEFGHSLLNQHIDTELTTKVEDIYHEYIKTVKPQDIDNKDYVSLYARESYSEFYAECFAQATLLKNPSKYAKMIMDETKKYKKRYNQMSLIDNDKKEKETEEELWVEGGGLGYPLNWEKYEEERKKINKQNNKD